MLNAGKMKSVIANVNNIRQQTHDTNFEDVKAYCVSKYEETIGIFMEIGKFLEDHIGLFVDRGIGYSMESIENRYMKRGGPSSCGVGLERNKVNLYFTNRKDGYYRAVYVWLNDGICFVYNIETERVTFITNNGKAKLGRRERLEYNSFPKLHLFPEWEEGTYPRDGYERFANVSAPLFETYFKDIKINSLGSLIDLKDMIDEDYQTAIQCVRCLEHDVEQICKDEQEFLDKMKKLKESTKRESNNER